MQLMVAPFEFYNNLLWEVAGALYDILGLFHSESYECIALNRTSYFAGKFTQLRIENALMFWFKNRGRGDVG